MFAVEVRSTRIFTSKRKSVRCIKKVKSTSYRIQLKLDARRAPTSYFPLLNTHTGNVTIHSFHKIHQALYKIKAHCRDLIHHIDRLRAYQRVTSTSKNEFHSFYLNSSRRRLYRRNVASLIRLTIDATYVYVITIPRRVLLHHQPHT